MCSEEQEPYTYKFRSIAGVMKFVQLRVAGIPADDALAASQEVVDP